MTSTAITQIARQLAGRYFSREDDTVVLTRKAFSELEDDDQLSDAAEIMRQDFDLQVSFDRFQIYIRRVGNT